MLAQMGGLLLVLAHCPWMEGSLTNVTGYSWELFNNK